MLGGTWSNACGGFFFGFHETNLMYIDGKNTLTMVTSQESTERFGLEAQIFVAEQNESALVC